jgi:hypothetical protein
LNFEGLRGQSLRDQPCAIMLSASGVGADTMDALMIIGLIGSVYLAGRLAEHRGRSFKTWAWIAAIIGPLAFPLVFLFPNLRAKNGNQA